MVRNQVQAAYQQDLILQGVKCVLYKVWSLYCTCGPCVLCGYHTECAVSILHQNQGFIKRDFDRNSKLVMYKNGLYFFFLRVICKVCSVHCTFSQPKILALPKWTLISNLIEPNQNRFLKSKKL